MKSHRINFDEKMSRLHLGAFFTKSSGHPAQPFGRWKLQFQLHIYLSKSEANRCAPKLWIVCYVEEYKSVT
jgi:hypothetical protein